MSKLTMRLHGNFLIGVHSRQDRTRMKLQEQKEHKDEKHRGKLLKKA